MSDYTVENVTFEFYKEIKNGEWVVIDNMPETWATLEIYSFKDITLKINVQSYEEAVQIIADMNTKMREC
jgi:hypothetical protein